MINPNLLFLEKALESLAGAESEAVNGRYNNAANRAYYASFQAAIAALMMAGTRPPGGGTTWDHGYVAAQFDHLINRRKLYPTVHRGVIARIRDLRRRADYTDSSVTQTETNRALQRTKSLVTAVQTGGGGTR
jgi:uncharacterized protein (UPF0332 family)